MKVRKVIALKEVANDLEEGRLFYDRKEPGIGDYFFDSLISDIESLKLFAGIHSKRFGYWNNRYSDYFSFIHLIHPLSCWIVTQTSLINTLNFLCYRFS